MDYKLTELAATGTVQADVKAVIAAIQQGIVGLSPQRVTRVRALVKLNLAQALNLARETALSRAPSLT